jgi:PAS domain S-box-containing protein
MSMSTIRDLMYEPVVKEAALKVAAAILTDLDTGMILWCSSLTEAMFGYRREELQGRYVDDLVPDESRERHRLYRERFAREPHTRPMGHGLALFGRRKDGTTFPVQVALSVTELLGHPVVVAFVVDVSGVIRLAAELAAAGPSAALEAKS